METYKKGHTVMILPYKAAGEKWDVPLVGKTGTVKHVFRISDDRVTYAVEFPENVRYPPRTTRMGTCSTSARDIVHPKEATSFCTNSCGALPPETEKPAARLGAAGFFAFTPLFQA